MEKNVVILDIDYVTYEDKPVIEDKPIIEDKPVEDEKPKKKKSK